MDLSALSHASVQATRLISDHAIPTRTLVPDAESVQHFQAAMNPEALQPPIQIEPSRPIAPANLGDTILGGMEKLGTQYGQSWSKMRASMAEMSDGPASFHQMMKFQVDVMQLSIQQDLTSRIVDRASQGIQTLFKNQ